MSLIAGAQYVLTIHPSLSARTFKDFVAYAKANPGKLNYASAGNGTPVHLAAELFKSVAGIDMRHVPYKGGGPAGAAVLSGESQVIFGSVTATMPQIRAGKLIALAVIYADEAEASERRAMRIADDAAERLGGLQVEGTTVVRDEDVVSAILADAEDHRADVIVLGARSMGTVHRWLVGSVSRSVLHLAQASVSIRPSCVTPSIEQEAEWAVPA